MNLWSLLRTLFMALNQYLVEQCQKKSIMHYHTSPTDLWNPTYIYVQANRLRQQTANNPASYRAASTPIIFFFQQLMASRWWHVNRELTRSEWKHTKKCDKLRKMGASQMATVFPLTVWLMVSILFHQFLSSTISNLKVTCLTVCWAGVLNRVCFFATPSTKQCFELIKRAKTNHSWASLSCWNVVSNREDWHL